MKMRVYNTLSREKEVFEPRVEGKVAMYTCGPTVYDLFHIGNARTFVMGDTMRRILEYLGYSVTYVQNFTDIDDKIIARAKALEIPMLELADRQIAEYFADADALNIRRADYHPRVTEHVEQIISYIEDLIAHGFAYTGDGDVFFDVRKYESYGELSGQKLEDLVMGSRVDVDEAKKYPADFVLWKSAKAGEPAWESPWGPGRPGWHIECSVMVKEILGGSIDIHVGGMDLKFPHHENERAQSEVLNPAESYVRYWLHVAFLNVRNAKMSKSVGNFLTARDLLEKYDADTLRFFLRSAHYRKPMNYDEELIASATQGLGRLKNAVESLLHYATNAQPASAKAVDMEAFEQAFQAALADDFNTADAWAVLFEFARDLNTRIAQQELGLTDAANAAELLIRLAGVLGVDLKTAKDLEAEVEQLIKDRQEARNNRDFKTSDAIRDMLDAKGIVLEDTPQGVRWKRK